MDDDAPWERDPGVVRPAVDHLSAKPISKRGSRAKIGNRLRRNPIVGEALARRPDYASRAALEAAVITLARTSSERAMEKIVEIMDTAEDHDTQLRAAALILDRAYGRPERADRMRAAEAGWEARRKVSLDHMSPDEVARLRELIAKARGG